MRRTRQNSSATGWPNDQGGRSTSHRQAFVGPARSHCGHGPASPWINQVERFFALLTDKQLRRGVHTSVQKLEDDIRTFSRPTPPTRNPSDGQNPPTTSSPQSNDFASEPPKPPKLRNQDTSRLLKKVWRDGFRSHSYTIYWKISEIVTAYSRPKWIEKTFSAA